MALWSEYVSVEPHGGNEKKATGRRPAVADLRRIGLVLNPSRDGTPVRTALSGWVTSRGSEVVDVDIGIAGADPGLQETDGLDLIVAAGGDGTVLGALRRTEGTGTPVLGVAYGHLGYLAEITLDQLGRTLDELADGRHSLLSLPGLDVMVAAPALSERPGTSLNDVVLSRVAGRGQAQLDISVAGEAFTRISTDALIVSTPLGSTAYNLSAGGPLAAPGIDAVLVTPVAPAGFYNRTLVASSADPITIVVLPESAPVNVETDGRVAAVMQPNGHLTVRCLPDRGTLVHLDSTSFYSRVRQRLDIPVAPVLAGRNAARASGVAPLTAE